MHTVSELGTNVPAFLGKLWKLVEDPETDDLICWAPNGRSFIISKQAQFARELLPHYYKHNNMASFVRQLNMYGFHKKVSVELGGLKCDRDEMEFAHQYFCRGHPYLLEHIKRKIASNKTQDPSQTPIKPELMNKMLTEVRSMRGRQEQFDSRLGTMKRENEALWRELALLRQKHHKQQQIVNKLIHFLVTLVQSNRNAGLPVKRRYPLMIDNKQCSKQKKISKAQLSPDGPAIHELDASDPDLDSEYIVAEMFDNEQNPTVESPEHHGINEHDLDMCYEDAIIQLPHESDIQEPKNLLKKRSKSRKKGRKTKVPIKIYIPSMESGEESREETVMTNLPADVDSPKNVIESKSTSLKPSVPVATLRSSKLAAMVANMNKNDEEIDIDLDAFVEDDQDQESSAKFENILTIPQLTSGKYSNSLDNAENSPGNIAKLSSVSGALEGSCNSPKNINSFSNEGQQPFNFTTGTDIFPENQNQKEDSAKNISKSMTLSCVNPTGCSETAFRLGSIEEVDTHLDSMQSDLENLRDVLRGEGYSIDANTLLGLFGAEDPMSFAMPMNPDLDPSHANLEKEVEQLHAVEPTPSNKELMAYPVSNNHAFDFDDDLFLEATSPAMISEGVRAGCNDPLDTDDKASIFDSLISNNGQTSRT